METSADPISHVAEIEPAAFEDELRRGDDVVVVDTRDHADFATWHVDPATLEDLQRARGGARREPGRGARRRPG